VPCSLPREPPPEILKKSGSPVSELKSASTDRCGFEELFELLKFSIVSEIKVRERYVNLLRSERLENVYSLKLTQSRSSRDDDTVMTSLAETVKATVIRNKILFTWSHPCYS
jgi:hypothetical protein